MQKIICGKGVLEFVGESGALTQEVNMRRDFDLFWLIVWACLWTCIAAAFVGWLAIVTKPDLSGRAPLSAKPLTECVVVQEGDV